MSGAVRRTIGLGVALGVTGLIGAVSRVPYAEHREQHAVVRLAWRSVGVAVRACRRLTPEELARLPAHMRREEECERRSLPEQLDVSLDGNAVISEVIRASGAREDRPLFVYRNLEVSPGRHRLVVAFTRTGPEAESGVARPGSGDSAPPRRSPGVAEGRLSLDTVLVLAPREIALVTYDASLGKLVVRGPGPEEASREAGGHRP
jgi:hypothetical protein